MRETRAAALAQEIARDQAASGLAPGSVFASAADLRARYGATEATLRQAVLILEERGIAFTRRGVGGGLVVGAPDSNAAARAASVYLASAGVTPVDCNPVTRATNLLTALSARASLNLEAADNLRAEARRLENSRSGRIAERHAKLRTLISASLGDPVLAFVAQAANQFLIDAAGGAEAGEDRTRAYWSNTRDKLEAFIAGDVPRAVALHEDNIALHTAEFDRPAASDPAGAPTARKAEWAARRMMAQVREMGWPAGARLGSEGELMIRFGVTRAILRQAVRILELHSAAKMQRGPSGGLFVLAPDRGRTAALVSRHLAEAGARPPQSRAFRQEIVLAAISGLELPTGRVATQLRRPLRPGKGEDVWGAGRAVQAAVLALWGNGAASFFCEALATFEAAAEAPRPPEQAEAAAAADLLEVLVASLAAGDPQRARRAFLDYRLLEERGLG